MAHAWWRVYITDTSLTSNVPYVTTLRMFDSAGTELTTGGTGTVSTSYFGTGWTEMLDTDDTSKWIATGAAPFWAKYHFSSAVDVAYFFIRPDNTDNSPTPLKIQYSDDDTNWFDAGSFTPVWNNIEDFTHKGLSWAVVTPAAGFYLGYRIRSTGTGDTNAVRIAEIQLREVASGSNIATGNGADADPGFIYASGDNADALSSYAFKAFNGSSLDFWSGKLSGAASALAWIAYFFKAPKKIVEFTVQNSALGVGSPSGLVLEGSNDGGENWTTISTFSGLSWTNGETKTFSVGSDVTATVSDTETLSDALAIRLNVNLPFSDTFSFIDTIISNFSFADQIQLFDAVLFGLVGIPDGTGGPADAAAAVSDSLNLVDSVGLRTGGTNAYLLVDGFIFVDQLITFSPWRIPVSDTLSLLDSVAVDRQGGNGDSVIISDGMTLDFGFSFFGDKLNLIDSVTYLTAVPGPLEIVVAIGDALDLNDTNFYAHIIDQLIVGDSLYLSDHILMNPKSTTFSYLRRYLNDVPI